MAYTAVTKDPPTNANPTPRSDKPAPSTTIDAEKAANETDNDNIAGVTGFNRRAAPATSPIAVAIDTNDIPISPQLISLIDLNTLQRTANPAAATTRLVDPELLISLLATTTDVNAPAIPNKPVANCSHDRLDRFFITDPITAIPADIITKPAPMLIRSLSGIAAANKAIDVNIPAKPVKPTAISFQSREPIDLTASDITSIPADNNTIEAAAPRKLLSGINIVNATISAITPAIPTNPLAICSHSISPINFNGTYIAVRPAAIETILNPMDLVSILPNMYVTNTISVNTPASPTNPLAICSHPMFPISTIAFAKIFILVAKVIILRILFICILGILLIIAIAAVISITNTVMPAKPLLS